MSTLAGGQNGALKRALIFSFHGETRLSRDEMFSRGGNLFDRNPNLREMIPPSYFHPKLDHNKTDFCPRILPVYIILSFIFILSAENRRGYKEQSDN